MYSLQYVCVCRHVIKIVEYVPDMHMCVDTVSKL